MRHVTLLEELEAYRPWNDQEERDRAELLRRLRSGEALYTRDNAAGHLTASAWVVSPDRTQVLMAYHNLYDSWSWLGGHADGDRETLVTAEKGRGGTPLSGAVVYEKGAYPETVRQRPCRSHFPLERWA